MYNSMKYLSIFITLFLFKVSTYAHCQIPCGIYDDHTRFILMREHITTIEKSMKMIEELSRSDNQNLNQIVRWINNKDEHADAFSHIVSYYFLAQRIKMVDETEKTGFMEYQKKVTLLHQMLIFAMKCKQTIDPENVEQLKLLVDRFEEIYFSAEDKEHIKEHHKD
jgi:nickel superoxide dismutase